MYLPNSELCPDDHIWMSLREYSWYIREQMAGLDPEQCGGGTGYHHILCLPPPPPPPPPPWKGRETYCFFPCIHPSLCLSVTKLCQLYNLKTFKNDFNETSYIYKAHSEDVSCHNSSLDIFGVISLDHLIICNAISCPLYNLITVRGISMKLYTFVKQIQAMCHAQES